MSAQDAALLTDDPAVADYYEQAVAAAAEHTPKIVANWITGELFRLLNETGESLAAAVVRIPAGHIAELLDLLKANTINGAVAKQVFEETFRSGQAPGAVVESKGLRQISDGDALLELARATVAANPKAVGEYKAGKTQAIKIPGWPGHESLEGPGQPAGRRAVAGHRAGRVAATNPGRSCGCVGHSFCIPGDA